MKTLERQFFRHMIRQIDYRESTRFILVTIKPIRFIMSDFCNKKNCDYKQLLYYLDKWSRYGMYDYGVALDLGWFGDVNKYPFRYREIIPARVKSKMIRFGLRDYYNNYSTDSKNTVKGNVIEMNLKGTETDKNNPKTFFKSEAEFYIFVLNHIDGPKRAKLLGITEELYLNSEKANEWKNEIFIRINPRYCKIDGAREVYEKLCQIHDHMVTID